MTRQRTSSDPALGLAVLIALGVFVFGPQAAMAEPGMPADFMALIDQVAMLNPDAALASMEGIEGQALDLAQLQGMLMGGDLDPFALMESLDMSTMDGDALSGQALVEQLTAQLGGEAGVAAILRGERPLAADATVEALLELPMPEWQPAPGLLAEFMAAWSDMPLFTGVTGDAPLGF